MNKPKIYLEPRNKFDNCICSESDIDTTYNVQEIIAMLKDDFQKETEDEDEAIIEAIEYFDYNIEPLSNHYSIYFFYDPEF
jgi:hypothetical protein